MERGGTLEDDAREEEGEGGSACCVYRVIAEHAAVTLQLT